MKQVQWIVTGTIEATLCSLGVDIGQLQNAVNSERGQLPVVMEAAKTGKTSYKPATERREAVGGYTDNFAVKHSGEATIGIQFAAYVDAVAALDKKYGYSEVSNVPARFKSWVSKFVPKPIDKPIDAKLAAAPILA